MEEIWRDIKGYEGYYQVSSIGRVRSVDRVIRNHLYAGRVRCLSSDKDGYSTVGLYKNGAKTVKVHRLVAEAFIPNPNRLPEVNHKDENKKNNCFENLEWCTTKYNLTYGNRALCVIGERNPRAKLSKKQVVEIRNNYLFGDSKLGQYGLAKKYGVSQHTIYSIVNNKNWKNI